MEKVANAIDMLEVGQAETIKGHRVERLAEFETETYSVDGQVVCFVEAVDIVCR